MKSTLDQMIWRPHATGVDGTHDHTVHWGHAGICSSPDHSLAFSGCLERPARQRALDATRVSGGMTVLGHRSALGAAAQARAGAGGRAHRVPVIVDNAACASTGALLQLYSMFKPACQACERSRAAEQGRSVSGAWRTGVARVRIPVPPERTQGWRQHTAACTAPLHRNSAAAQRGARRGRGRAPHQAQQVGVLAVVGRALVVHVGDHVVQEGDVGGLAQPWVSAGRGHSQAAPARGVLQRRRPPAPRSALQRSLVRACQGRSCSSG